MTRTVAFVALHSTMKNSFSVKQRLTGCLSYTQHIVENLVIPLLECLLKNEAFPEETLEFIDEAEVLLQHLKCCELIYPDERKHSGPTLWHGQKFYSIAWMRLHGEPWENVSTFWRRIYGLSCLVLCLLHLREYLMVSLSILENSPVENNESKMSQNNETMQIYSKITSSEDSSPLALAFYYADMGLIMGGLIVEPWNFTSGTLAEKSNGSSNTQSLIFLQNQLDNVVRILHNLFSEEFSSLKINDTAFCLFEKKFDFHLYSPLLFHVWDIAIFCQKLELESFPPETYPTPNSEFYEALSYEFSENKKTGLWEFVVLNPLQKFHTNSPVVHKGRKNVFYTHMTPLIDVKCFEPGQYSVWDLLNLYIYPKKPFMFRRGASHFPALESWKDIPKRLLQLGRLRLIPVEIGSSYTTKSWSQRIMTIENYVKEFLCIPGSKQRESMRQGYIAQHPMLEHMPFLQKEFLIPDLVSAAADVTKIIRLLWIGPAETISPYHTDSHDNLFTQISGFKIFKLVPASFGSEHFYTFSNMLKNTSSIEPVDIIRFSVNQERYPMFPAAEEITCILGPGDQLFIPKGWWHFVKALTPSVSYSVWFDT